MDNDDRDDDDDDAGHTSAAHPPRRGLTPLGDPRRPPPGRDPCVVDPYPFTSVKKFWKILAEISGIVTILLV